MSMSTPALSIIVCFFNMQARGAALAAVALQALPARRRQSRVRSHRDRQRLARAARRGHRASFGPEFRYHFFETTSKSPAAALNFGVSQARARHVMIMVDGAHICTPRVVWCTATAMGDFPNPLIATASLSLGAAPTVTNLATGTPAPTAVIPTAPEEAAAWDQAAEDRLLATVDWQRNGYELFRLARSFNDAAMGWFGCSFESSCFTIAREWFEKLGGFDTRFVVPAGGMVSLDFFQRAVARPELMYVMLLGEATFHQHHGSASKSTWERFNEEYRSIRGADFKRVTRMPAYFGHFAPQALPLAELSARIRVRVLARAQASRQQVSPG